MSDTKASDLVRTYADAWIAHQRAVRELKEATDRELDTRVAYQEAWRECKHLHGAHIISGALVLVEPHRDYPPVSQIVSGLEDR